MGNVLTQDLVKDDHHHQPHPGGDEQTDPPSRTGLQQQIGEDEQGHRKGVTDRILPAMTVAESPNSDRRGSASAKDSGR